MINHRAYTLARFFRPVTLVAQLTWLDYVRRKDLYVVAIFMSLFVIAAIAVRLIRIEDGGVATAHFLMSMGLNLSHIMAAFLAATFAARNLPEEFERGTLMPLLAKPVRLGEVLAGKMAACLAMSVGSYLLFALASLAVAPQAPGQQMTTFMQVISLQVISLTFLSVLAMFFSLYLPVNLSVLMVLLWYFGAGFILNILRQSIVLHWDGAREIVDRLFSILPDPTLLFHIESFATAGSNLPSNMFFQLAAYGLAWTAIIWLWTVQRFERMRL